MTLKKCVFILICNWIIATVTLAYPPLSLAFTINSDPQYVVMNFSTINELNWAAPETEWQQDIKPQIIQELAALKQALPPGTPQRRLAWSTLMEYMNFPLDEPGPDSPYVIKVRRIFEIAEQENLPVFIPLNGFQWWDELPELYNWWDPDGTHTSAAFFKRQDNPEDFKRRFVAGYNPNNKWNVEWQDWDTPMELNWRNWGGGEFRLAPPPNLVDYRLTRPAHEQPTLTYHQVLEQRLTAILTQIANSADDLQAQSKSELFAGITIGTEVSLNASVTAKDEFEPYGYRGMSDICSQTQNCPPLIELSPERTQLLRQQVVHTYLTDLTRLATKLGLPKQRIYTHVWSEASVGEPRYVNYAASAQGLYSRPGMSFYGFAEDPYALPVWQTSQQQTGFPAWGAVEYAVPKEAATAQKALTNVLSHPTPQRSAAKVVILYNWSEHKDTPAIPALKASLVQPVGAGSCELAEILPMTERFVTDPSELTWSYLPDAAKVMPNTLKLHIYKGVVADSSSLPLRSVELDPNAESAALPEDLRSGVYTWYVESVGCAGTRKQFSEPKVILKSLQVEDNTPRIVKWWLELRDD